MSKRKIPQEESCEITKNIKLNTRSSYNVKHEHNYFHDINKKKNRWFDNNECSDHTEIISNDDDKCDSIPDCLTFGDSSTDEEDYPIDMRLSHIIKIEQEKELLHAFENKKCANDSLPFNEDQMDRELNNTNISNDSNNIISENLVINDGKQYKIMQIIPLTNGATTIQNKNITNGTEFQTKLCNQPRMKLIVKNNFTHNELLSNASMNTKARKDLYDKNLRNDLLSSSLHLSNPLFVKTAQSLYDNADFTKADTSTKNVCPPLHWIHLIYLAIKNSATENVTCYDIQRIVRCWFPYYCKKSYVKFIRIILSHINYNCQKYFHCNPFTIIIHQDDTWTINSIYINILEESLMKIVENNEDEIKSAMAHPDQLSTIVNGYGILYLGCSQNAIKN